METNTVILSLHEYNELRDFKNNIEMENTFYVSGYEQSSGNSYNYHIPQVTRYISTEGAVKEISLKNDELKKQITELQVEIQNLRYPERKELSTADIKKMSICEFRKWKKKLY